jgi:hypothetical protein
MLIHRHMVEVKVKVKVEVKVEVGQLQQEG